MVWSRRFLLLLPSFSPSGDGLGDSLASSAFSPSSSFSTTSARGPRCSSCSGLVSTGWISGASAAPATLNPAGGFLGLLSLHTRCLPLLQENRTCLLRYRSTSAPAAPRSACTTANSWLRRSSPPQRISLILRNARQEAQSGPLKKPHEEQLIHNA